ncbi:MAG: hypothetical protein ACRYHQ_24140 [Janthinobacterium lividum]
MHPVSTVTPGVLATIAAEWTEHELRAAAAVLLELVHDKRGAVPMADDAMPVMGDAAE